MDIAYEYFQLIYIYANIYKHLYIYIYILPLLTYIILFSKSEVPAKKNVLNLT